MCGEVRIVIARNGLDTSYMGVTMLMSYHSLDHVSDHMSDIHVAQIQ